MIDVDILERDKNYIELVVRNVPLPILNAIRRIIQLEVPTVAVDSIIFYENNTPLYEEIIAHRIGLIPLKSDVAVRKYRSPEECRKCFSSDEEGYPAVIGTECEGCFVGARLKAYSDDGVVTVYSKDLIIDDPEIKPVYDNIPIIILGPGHRLTFDARIRVGRGIEHSKWSPVSVAGTKYVAVIKTGRIKDREAIEKAKKCVNVCPVDILSFDEKESSIVVSDRYRCTLCMQCVKECPPGSISVEHDDSEYILFFESTGQLSLRSILDLATELLINKLDELIKQVEKEVEVSSG